METAAEWTTHSTYIGAILLIVGILGFITILFRTRKSDPDGKNSMGELLFLGPALASIIAAAVGVLVPDLLFAWEPTGYIFLVSTVIIVLLTIIGVTRMVPDALGATWFIAILASILTMLASGLINVFVWIFSHVQII